MTESGLLISCAAAQGFRASLGFLGPLLAGDVLDDPLPVLLPSRTARAFIRTHTVPPSPVRSCAWKSRVTPAASLAVAARTVLRIDVQRGGVDTEQRLPVGKSQDLHHGGVDVDHLAARRGSVDADRHALDEAAVPLLGRQRLR